ncbi:MAG: protein kinase [Planctomycetaceae bacterium]|nr:protein kinase [Planctomycetaceae bacterium]
MSWRPNSDDAGSVRSGAVGLSSGSVIWPLNAETSSAASNVQDDSEQVGQDKPSLAELSVTIDLVKSLADEPEFELESDSESAPKTESSAAGTSNSSKLHLGSGKAVRVERRAGSAEGSTRWAKLSPSDSDSDFSPSFEDTDRFELVEVSGPEADNVGPEPNRSRLWGWLDAPRLRNFIASLALSAEAGGKMVDHAVGLAIGSQASLTTETQKLLHQRLKITTLLLFFGFVVSLVAESFFFGGWRSSAEFMRLWSEVFLTTIMGFISWRLLTGCPHFFRNLRLIEFLVFASASWILALNSWVVLERGDPAEAVATLSGPWLALVFTYALFIPNHWRRALSGIASMAFAPVILALLAGFFSTRIALFSGMSAEYTHGLVNLALLSGFSTVAATWGVYTIGSLRSEAYSAKQFGQYSLSLKLGTGGMGDVYVAEHLLLKRPCAIKVIKPHQSNDPKMLERFEREVRSTAKLTHWNTVAIYDYGRAEDGTFFYVMEYLPGLNLSQIVKMFGPLPPGRVIHLLVQICDALAEAHHHGMIHRDLKPANIFASKRGSKYDVAKLLDFGLVRRKVRREGQVETPGAAVGSPLYMSPEQALGRSMDHRSDIYSLGVTAYFLLTGQPPFRYSEPLKVMRAHAKKTPPTFESLGVDVPADLAQVIMKCLCKSPEDRYPDVESLRQAFLQCASSGDWTWLHAAQWWKLHRCPEKSGLDLAIENDRLSEWLALSNSTETASSN